MSGRGGWDEWGEWGYPPGEPGQELEDYYQAFYQPLQPSRAAAHKQEPVVRCTECRHGLESAAVYEAGILFLVHIDGAHRGLCERPRRLWELAAVYGWRDTVNRVCPASVRLPALVEALRRYRPGGPADGLATSLALHALTRGGEAEKWLREAARWAVRVTPGEAFAAAHPAAHGDVAAALRGRLDGLRRGLEAQAERLEYGLEGRGNLVGKLVLAERLVLAGYDLEPSNPLAVARRILGGWLPPVAGPGTLGEAWLREAAAAVRGDPGLLELADELCRPARCVLLARGGPKVLARIAGEASLVLGILSSGAGEPLTAGLVRAALMERIERLRKMYGDAYVLVFEHVPWKNGKEIVEKNMGFYGEAFSREAGRVAATAGSMG